MKMDEKTNVTGYVRFLYSKCIVVYLINLYISNLPTFTPPYFTQYRYKKHTMLNVTYFLKTVAIGTALISNIIYNINIS